LGWSRRTDFFLLGKDECHGPFPDEASAVAASQRPQGSYGYGDIRPNLIRVLRE
jgi:hypothetical protein